MVLPKELRRTFAITTETPLEIFTEGCHILLRKVPSRRCLRPLRWWYKALYRSWQIRLPQLPESVDQEINGKTAAPGRGGGLYTNAERFGTSFRFLVGLA